MTYATRFLISDARVEIRFVQPLWASTKPSVAPATRDTEPSLDEFVVLRYRATNEPPYSFEWMSYRDAMLDYAAVLTRISSR